MSRQVKDNILNGITYLCAFLGVLFLGSILVYVLTNGLKLINWDLIKNDYWSQNYLVAVTDNEPKEFVCDSCNGYFSTKWGVSFADEVTSHKENVITIEYIAPGSPFENLTSLTAGDMYGTTIPVDEGYMIEKLDYIDSQGNAAIGGKILKQDAKALQESLDDASEITSIYIQSPGEGIRGSLIATLYLILISLVISLPIGIASAIYLNEYADKSKMNRLIRQGIETLTGVPSIVYGLMGVSVLFPVTTVFGATGTSILLGGLTMAIILLPTIIRSVEEALIVVPQSLRDASLSLGATKSQTIFKVVLPCCMNGILTGVLLSIGRVIGESAALIYTMGTFISDNPVVNGPATSLSLMIWSFMSAEQPNFELACAISIIILAVVLVLNIIVKIVGKKLSKNFV